MQRTPHCRPGPGTCHRKDSSEIAACAAAMQYIEQTQGDTTATEVEGEIGLTRAEQNWLVLITLFLLSSNLTARTLL